MLQQFRLCICIFICELECKVFKNLTPLIWLFLNLSLDLPLLPESRNTPPRDIDPRGGPLPRDPRDPRDLPPRDLRRGPPGPREGPPGPGRPPRYDAPPGPDRYGPRGGPPMWPGHDGQMRMRGPHPRDLYGPGPGPRGPPYRPSYPGPPMDGPGAYGMHIFILDKS